MNNGGGSTRILKVDAAQQVVYGWAGQYANADGSPVVDLQGDIVEPAEVERAMYDFVLKHASSGLMHEGKKVGDLVACLVTSPDVVKAFFGDEVKVPLGVIVGFKYADAEIFKRVIDGEFEMFSIQGSSERVPVDVEAAA